MRETITTFKMKNGAIQTSIKPRYRETGKANYKSEYAKKEIKSMSSTPMVTSPEIKQEPKSEPSDYIKQLHDMMQTTFNQQNNMIAIQTQQMQQALASITDELHNVKLQVNQSSLHSFNSI